MVLHLLLRPVPLLLGMGGGARQNMQICGQWNPTAPAPRINFPQNWVLLTRIVKIELCSFEHFGYIHSGSEAIRFQKNGTGKLVRVPSWPDIASLSFRQ
jgi:hypothetical protein